MKIFEVVVGCGFSIPFFLLFPPFPFVHVFENCYFSVVCVLVLFFIRFRQIFLVFLSPFPWKLMVLLIYYCLVGLHVDILESLIGLSGCIWFEMERTMFYIDVKVQGNPMSDKKVVSGISASTSRCNLWQLCHRYWRPWVDTPSNNLSGLEQEIE